MQISKQKGRNVAAFADSDHVVVVEREKEYDKWGEYRITLTREEIAKLANQFPVTTAEK